MPIPLELFRKTNRTMETIARAQTRGNVVAYIDTRKTFSFEDARAHGVRVSELVLSTPDDEATALEILYTLARSGSCEMIVLNGVPLYTSHE